MSQSTDADTTETDDHDHEQPDPDPDLSMPDETLDTEWVRRGDLLPNSWNPNGMHSQKQEELIQSILTHGWTAPLVVAADDTIIDGEQRWHASGDVRIRTSEALTPDGVDSGHIPVHRVELDPEDDHAKVATLQHNLQGEHDDEQVGEIIADLDSVGLRDQTEDLLNLQPIEAQTLIDDALEDDDADDATDDDGDDDTDSTPANSGGAGDQDEVLMQRFTIEVAATESRILKLVLGDDLQSEQLLRALDTEETWRDDDD